MSKTIQKGIYPSDTMEWGGGEAGYEIVHFSQIPNWVILAFVEKKGYAFQLLPGCVWEWNQGRQQLEKVENVNCHSLQYWLF